MAKPVDLPGNGIRQSDAAKPDRQRIERIEHRAREQEEEIENAGDRVEYVVAARAQREYRVKEKPTGSAEGHSDEKLRQRAPLHTDAQQPAADDESQDGLHDRDEHVKDDLAEQVLAAAKRVGKHFVENAVVAIEKKRPWGIRGDGEAGHGQNAGEKEFVVVNPRKAGRGAQRGVDADTEHQHVQQRIKQIPENERDIRGADARFAIHHGGKGAHDASLFSSPRAPEGAVSSTKMSSRVAPRTST